MYCARRPNRPRSLFSSELYTATRGVLLTMFVFTPMTPTTSVVLAPSELIQCQRWGSRRLTNAKKPKHHSNVCGVFTCFLPRKTGVFKNNSVLLVFRTPLLKFWQMAYPMTSMTTMVALPPDSVLLTTFRSYLLMFQGILGGSQTHRYIWDNIVESISFLNSD